MILEHNPQCELEVDGGIDARTIGEAAAAGATVFVAGNAVFGSKATPANAVRELARLVSSAVHS
jgi:ribulose-phosphate 3-epimerase